MKKEISILAAVMTLAAAGITSWGQPNTPTVTAAWSPPTYGTAVAKYVGQLVTWPAAGGDTLTTTWEVAAPETTMVFSYGFGQVLKVRVAGVDAQDRQGPWSLWSDEWVDNGPPGQPSVPLLGLVMVEQ